MVQQRYLKNLFSSCVRMLEVTFSLRSPAAQSLVIGISWHVPRPRANASSHIREVWSSDAFRQSSFLKLGLRRFPCAEKRPCGMLPTSWGKTCLEGRIGYGPYLKRRLCHIRGFSTQHCKSFRLHDRRSGLWGALYPVFSPTVNLMALSSWFNTQQENPGWCIGREVGSGLYAICRDLHHRVTYTSRSSHAGTHSCQSFQIHDRSCKLRSGVCTVFSCRFQQSALCGCARSHFYTCYSFHDRSLWDA